MTRHRRPRARWWHRGAHHKRPGAYTVAELTPPAPIVTGDAIRLDQYLVNATWFGIVAPDETPEMMTATIEIVADEGLATIPVLSEDDAYCWSPEFAGATA